MCRIIGRYYQTIQYTTSVTGGLKFFHGLGKSREQVTCLQRSSSNFPGKWIVENLHMPEIAENL